MSYRHLLGTVLLSLPVLVIFYWMYKDIGWRGVLFVIGFIVFICATIWGGLLLLLP